MIEDGKFIKVGGNWKISDFGYDRFYKKENYGFLNIDEIKKARMIDLFIIATSFFGVCYFVF